MPKNALTFESFRRIWLATMFFLAVYAIEETESAIQNDWPISWALELLTYVTMPVTSVFGWPESVLLGFIANMGAWVFVLFAGHAAYRAALKIRRAESKALKKQGEMDIHQP